MQESGQKQGRSFHFKNSNAMKWTLYSLPGPATKKEEILLFQMLTPLGHRSDSRIREPLRHEVRRVDLVKIVGCDHHETFALHVLH